MIELMAVANNVSSDETYVPIAKLQIGKTYRQIFLIESITSGDNMVTAKGDAFTCVTLRDISGNIEGKIWGKVPGLVEGMFAMMTIAISKYQKTVQFQATPENIIVQKISPLNRYDYIKGISANLLQHYAAELQTEIASLDDEVYRNVLSVAVHHLDLIKMLKESPYGLTGPMAYVGGLLVHVTHTLRIAKVTCAQAKDREIILSPSLVIAGCILRNIGWHTTTQLKGGDEIKSRDAFYMTGIDRASARFINHLMLTHVNDLHITIPEEKIQALENMCNHFDDIHTLEGQIVFCANNMANILNAGHETLQRKQVGNWRDQKLFIGHL
jgi:hypothetical protein